MKDWQYTFEPVSRAEWLHQIEIDLKQKPIETLYAEWWPGEPLVPVMHPEDITFPPAILPPQLFKNPPSILEWINVRDENSSIVNASVLEALRYGAQVIVLYPKGPGMLPWDEWLQEVQLDIIEVQLAYNPNLGTPLAELLNHTPADIAIRIEMKQDSDHSIVDLISILRSNQINNNTFRFVYTFPSSGVWDYSIVEVINQIKTDLDHWMKAGLEAKDFFKNCILSTEADPMYFKQIVQARTLQLLWLNFKKHYVNAQFAQEGGNIECHIHPQSGEEPSRFLIRASMSGLAASMCGIQVLAVHHRTDGDVPAYFARINRNLHHLLHLESNMYKGTDPLAGAYAFDFYTHAWTERIWKQLAL